MGRNGPKKSKSCPTYLEISTLVNLEVLSTSLTLISQDFTSKIYFYANWSQIGQTGPKTKIYLFDLFEILLLYESIFESAYN